MNKRKLAKLFLDKQTELGMTQEAFAKWFTALGGNQVSHGFIQTMTSLRKTSTPEWSNMKTIAKMWGVTLDELNLYLENDDIETIFEASQAYKKLGELPVTKQMIEDLTLKHLSSDEVLELGLKLLNDGIGKMKDQIQWAKDMAKMLKQINPNQI